MEHALTPWLTLSGLAEMEGNYQRFNLDDDKGTEHRKETSAVLQLGIEVKPWDRIKGKLLLEYDTEVRQLNADEVFLALDAGDWEVELGRLYTPFGAYLSHFVSGPILEFGETGSSGVKINFNPSDLTDFSLMLYQGRAEKSGSDTNLWDWALAWETWLSQSLSVGLSYQSDLADSDSRLLGDENNRYLQRVAGLNGFLLWTTPSFDISFEALSATSSFDELSNDRDKSSAWNFEFAHFLSPHVQWAIRLEGSQEIEDEPKRQIGAALTWRTGPSMSITLEYLHGIYKPGVAVNDEGDAYEHVGHIGALLSIAF